MATIKEFDYKDSKGKESRKTVLVVRAPNALWAGYDLMELDAESQVQLATELEYEHSRYLEVLASITDKYDLRTMYRQYKPESMTNVTSEEY